jgi:cell division transport system permease protein
MGAAGLMLSLKRAVQDIRRNRFLNLVTVITIALAVLIVSAFILFFINAADLINSWKQGVRVMVYLEKGTANGDALELQKQLSAMEGVAAVDFISREAALKLLRDQMQRQASLLDNLRENPLPDAFEIQLSPGFQDWEKIERLAQRLEQMPRVEEVEYGRQWLGRFSYFFDLFRLAATALGALFFMATVFFVANTIRLVLYSRREEVEIMRLVGAEDRFIKAPFFIEGIIQGALGGIIGLAALFVIYMAISANINQDVAYGAFQIRFLPLHILPAVLLGAMMVGWIGSFVSLKQFLR